MNGDLLHKQRAPKPKVAQPQEALAAPVLPVRPSQQQAPHEVDRAKGGDAKGAQGKEQKDEKSGRPGQPKAQKPEAQRQRELAPGAKVRFFEARPGGRADVLPRTQQRQGVQPSAGSGDLWRAWVENAYAAWKGGAQGPERQGHASEVLSALTGQTCTAYPTSGASEGLWLTLAAAAARLQPIAALSHGGDDDPERPKGKRWQWHAVTALRSEGSERTVEVEGAAPGSPSEVLAWPVFLAQFDEVVVAE